MPGTNEAFSRVKIDAQLKDQGWDVLNPNAVRFEYVLPDKTKADYVLCDRHGRALAVIEAKRAAINPAEAEAQAYFLRDLSATSSTAREPYSLKDYLARRAPRHSQKTSLDAPARF